MDTNDQSTIETEQLQKGLTELNSLAQEEYQKDLDSILTDSTRTQDERLLRIGRLLGVVLKKPFATDVPIDPIDSVTGAYRAWYLDKSAFALPEKQATWEYGVLESLCKEEEVYPPTVYDFAQYLQNERKFFERLVNATRKYICRDPAIRQKIDTEVKTSKQGGGAVQLTTTGAATAVATTLVQHVPWLTVGEIPLITGLVLLIMSIGIDAFCQWSATYYNTGGKPLE